MPRPFKIVIAWYCLAGLFFAPIFMDHQVPLILPFAWHRALHILGAVMMIGNVFVTAGWSIAARYAGSWSLLRWSVKTISWMDVFFTAPGFFLLVSNGVFLASVWGGIYAWSWLVVAMVLLGITGTVAVVVIPLQVRLWKLAEELEDGPDERFERALRRWGWFGTIASVLPLAILLIMILKPRFW